VTQLELAIVAAKCLIMVGICIGAVTPVMIWLERRGSALMQNRLGPNRIGPLGLLQTLADGIKMAFKEDFNADHVKKFFYPAAPVVSLVPALLTFSVIPFAAPIVIGGTTYTFQVADLDVGVLFILAVVSLGVYGIILGGWASNNKYSLLGSLRSSSQMISYELSMGLALVAVLMVYGSATLGDIAARQGDALITIGSFSIPKWGILVQPVSFIIFLTCTYAETNRLPFDLPEGESEIVAGYHLEYSSMKFGIFMMAEYTSMFTASGLVALLYFGGWQLLPGMGWLLNSLGLTGMDYEWARVGFQVASFVAKTSFFLWLFVWVRWTIPRFRYDQLMDLGWKMMLPLALANVVLTGFLIAFGVI
jgi:NADH-quinone oxidoreductase subunit H